MAPGGMGMVAVWAFAAPGQQASAKLAATTETVDIMFRQVFIGCSVYADVSLSVLQLIRPFRSNGKQHYWGCGAWKQGENGFVFCRTLRDGVCKVGAGTTFLPGKGGKLGWLSWSRCEACWRPIPVEAGIGSQEAGPGPEPV
jgi:hypothetical protein